MFFTQGGLGLDMSVNNERTATLVSWNSILINSALSAFKLIAGVVSGSSAMISDAAHSMTDVFSTLIVIAGVRMANKKSDKEHQYGHERFECAAALLLAGVLFVTGLGIGYASVRRIMTRGGEDLAMPGTLALAAAVVSIAVKEGMYRYVRTVALKIDSCALIADAWHHRSDALSSVASFAGILGARMGYPVLDPTAGAVICAFIIKVAFGVFMDSIGRMTDRACDDKTLADIRAVILEHGEVEGIDQLKTRIFGDRIYVDVEIGVDGGSTLCEAHDAAERVHEAIEARFPKVKHCMVHVNPANNEPQHDA
jgi:cation diffusion facilitator family transporter